MADGGGPLRGVRVLELAGLGPAPFGGMVLADLGAEVIRVDRPARAAGLFGGARSVMDRGRRSIAVDLKQPDGVAIVLDLVARSDVLVEAYRPGVAERLGVGPDPCLARQPSLIYTRMTGWGQDGPLAQAPGHDINYIAVGGALGAIGRAGQPPTPPLSLVGDFGGGGMLMVVGILAALLEARTSGLGQVVDVAMVDGAALLMAPFFGPPGRDRPRGTGLLDSGAPFYDAYECADGEYVAVGAMEPQFHAALCAGLGLAVEPDSQMDAAQWAARKDKMAAVFKQQTRAEWVAALEGSDACLSPVLRLSEVADHPHIKTRRTVVDVNGSTQPAPAPRFSRTPAEMPAAPPTPIGADTAEILAELGRDEAEVARLRDAMVVS